MAQLPTAPFNVILMTQGEYGRAYEHSDVLQVQDRDGGIADVRMTDGGEVRIIVREGFMFEMIPGVGAFCDFEYIRISRIGASTCDVDHATGRFKR